MSAKLNLHLPALLEQRYQRLRERRLPGIARSTLQARADCHLHPNDAQRHCQAVTQALTRGRPGVCRSLKSMVNMQGRKRRQGLALREARQQVHKHR